MHVSVLGACVIGRWAIILALAAATTWQGRLPPFLRRPASNPTPPVWVEEDINSSTGTCSVTDASGTITSNGFTDSTADKFTYCYQAVSGDKQIIAQFTNCTTTGAFGEECGLMVRRTLNANAINFACVFNDTQVISEWRTSAGGTTNSDVGPVATSGWLRMRVTAAGVASCDYSPTISDWSTVKTQTITLDSTYYLGFVTNSNDHLVAGSPTATATIANATLGNYTTNDSGGYRAHWQGYGYQTTGGRTGGTRVCEVNTLSISGTPTWGSTGDLLDCLALPPGCSGYTDSQTNCANYVVFSVSGTIGSTATDRQVTLSTPYTTIAGQTSPMHTEGSDAGSDAGPGGIQIVNIQFIIDAPHVVVQHLKFRYLEPDSGGECFVCIGIGGGSHTHIHHVVLDHVSTAWNRGNVGSSGLAFPQIFVSRYTGGHIAIIDSIVAEPIYDGGGGSLGMGVDIGTASTTTIARTLFVSALWRNPTVAVPGKSLLYNNVVYNAGANGDCGDTNAQAYLLSDRSDDSGETGGGVSAFINNVFIRGPNTSTTLYWLCGVADAANFANGISLHLSGNAGTGVTACTGNGQWGGFGTGSAFPPQTNVITAGSGSNIRVDDLDSGDLAEIGAFDISLIATSGDCSHGENDDIRDAVLANAGARPNDGTEDRDDTDARLVADVLDGTSGDADNDTTWATIVSLHGGIPAIAERSRAWSAPANPNNTGTCGGSRTIMECYLENDSSFGAQRVEVSQGVP